VFYLPRKKTKTHCSDEIHHETQKEHMDIYGLDKTTAQLTVGYVLDKPSGAKVLECHQMAKRVYDDTFAIWIAVCHWAENTHHPFVVWNIIARPEGFVAERGDYCSTLEQALGTYKKRVGDIVSLITLPTPEPIIYR
jgi:hypothetical protein